MPFELIYWWKIFAQQWKFLSAALLSFFRSIFGKIIVKCTDKLFACGWRTRQGHGFYGLGAALKTMMAIIFAEKKMLFRKCKVLAGHEIYRRIYELLEFFRCCAMHFFGSFCSALCSWVQSFHGLEHGDQSQCFGIILKAEKTCSCEVEDMHIKVNTVSKEA